MIERDYDKQTRVCARAWLAWILLVSAASATFVAWVLIQIVLLMRIGG